jgi:hypothetical protein
MDSLLCSECASQKIIALYDRDLDCTVGYKCKACGHTWKRPLTEVLAVADPSAFKDIDG